MMKKEKIKVFSAPHCPYCIMVKDYLDEKGVEYENIDVSENQEAGLEMFNKSHNMGVPQLWIGDNIVIGFDPTAIDKLTGNN